MEAYEAVIGRRAIRAFKQKKVDRSVLEKICDTGRLAPSAMNRQPLKFLVIDNDLRHEVFRSLTWAGHLQDWTPSEDQQPAAYILILVDPEITKNNFEYDVGLAAEAMMVAARSFGLESAPLYVGSNEKIKSLPAIKRMIPTLIIPLGYPAQESVAEDASDSLSYYMEGGKLHVPKRKKEEVILFAD